MKITQAELKALLRYEPETGNFYWLIKRSHNALVGDLAGCKKKAGYIRISIFAQEYWAHRLAWLYMVGAWPVADVDHKNGLGTDNRWCNLRSASRKQNLWNAKKPVTNSTGFKGVSIDKRNGRFFYSFRNIAGGPSISRYGFTTAQDAFTAYCQHVKEVRGEFVNTGSLQ